MPFSFRDKNQSNSNQLRQVVWSTNDDIRIYLIISIRLNVAHKYPN